MSPNSCYFKTFKITEENKSTECIFGKVLGTRNSPVSLYFRLHTRRILINPKQRASNRSQQSERMQRPCGGGKERLGWLDHNMQHTTNVGGFKKCKTINRWNHDVQQSECRHSLVDNCVQRAQVTKCNATDAKAVKAVKARYLHGSIFYWQRVHHPLPSVELDWSIFHTSITVITFWR